MHCPIWALPRWCMPYKGLIIARSRLGLGAILKLIDTAPEKRSLGEPLSPQLVFLPETFRKLSLWSMDLSPYGSTDSVRGLRRWLSQNCWLIHIPIPLSLPCILPSIGIRTTQVILYFTGGVSSASHLKHLSYLYDLYLIVLNFRPSNLRPGVALRTLHFWPFYTKGSGDEQRNIQDLEYFGKRYKRGWAVGNILTPHLQYLHLLSLWPLQFRKIFIPRVLALRNVVVRIDSLELRFEARS